MISNIIIISEELQERLSRGATVNVCASVKGEELFETLQRVYGFIPSERYTTFYTVVPITVEIPQDLK